MKLRAFAVDDEGHCHFAGEVHSIAGDKVTVGLYDATSLLLLAIPEITGIHEFSLSESYSCDRKLSWRFYSDKDAFVEALNGPLQASVNRTV